jgi:hypothetical protein
LIVERTDFTTEVTEDTEKRRGTKGTEGKGSQERKRAGKKESRKERMGLGGAFGRNLIGGEDGDGI